MQASFLIVAVLYVQAGMTFMEPIMFPNAALCAEAHESVEAEAMDILGDIPPLEGGDEVLDILSMCVDLRLTPFMMPMPPMPMPAPPPPPPEPEPSI